MPTIIDELITVLTFRGEAEGIQRTRQQIRGMADDFSAAARGLGIIGAGLTALGGISLGMGISWETAWTDVLKTVNGTDAELANLETRLRRMAKDDIPLPVEGLADIAASAGQLGILTPNIEGFTKVIAGLSATTNLAAEQGSQDLARLANITQMSQDDFDRLGATIVHLGNNFATTEAEIVEMSLRLAANGKLIGLTEAQILALATGLTSVGIRAEAGGTAFSRVFADMQNWVQTGGAELHLFNELLGKDFATLFEAAPDQAVVEFVAALKGMIDSGGNVHAILEELGFDNVRIRDSLLRSAGAGDLMADALAQGTQAWEDNIALTREAALRYQTSASQIQFAKNQARDLGITVGEILAPGLISVLAALKPIIESVGELVEEHPGLIKVVAVLAGGLLFLSGTLFAAAGAMKIVAFGIGPLTALIGFLRSGTLLLRGQLLLLAIQQKITAAATWLLNIAMYANPVGLIALAVLGLIAAFIGLAYILREQTNWWQYIRAAMAGVWDIITSFLLTAWKGLAAVWENELKPALVELGQSLGLVDKHASSTAEQMEQFTKRMEQAAEWAGILGGAAANNLILTFRAMAEAIDLVNKGIDLLNRGLETFGNLGPRAQKGILGGLSSLLPGGLGSLLSGAKLLGFAEGGVVPGLEGQPMPAIVHGGEGIFTADMVRRMSLGPEALAPSLPPAVPAFGGGGRSVTVDVGDIIVHVGAGADGEEIAATIARSLRDQIEDLVGDFDGPIVR